MDSALTPRQRNRAATLVRIKELALAQVASEGAAGLSLRAVARELNLVSSAIYRYYASRDDLLTDLLLDGYNALAAHVEVSVASRTGVAGWIAGCRAVREWAKTQPHWFSLLYGSPVPGYEAPVETVEPATRVLRALLTPVASEVRDGGVLPDRGRQGPLGESLDGSLREQLERVCTTLGVQVDAPTMAAATAAWAQVVGMVTLEINGHFVGGFEPADALFDEVVRRSSPV